MLGAGRLCLHGVSGRPRGFVLGVWPALIPRLSGWHCAPLCSLPVPLENPAVGLLGVGVCSRGPEASSVVVETQSRGEGTGTGPTQAGCPGCSWKESLCPQDSTFVSSHASTLRIDLSFGPNLMEVEAVSVMGRWLWPSVCPPPPGQSNPPCVHGLCPWGVGQTPGTNLNPES